MRKRKVFCESNHKSCEFKKTLADFASNDYLGLSNRIDSLRKAYKLATNPKLSAPRASMLVNGYSKLHRRLERRLARINGFESCILVGSGFLANIALIESLVRKCDKIFIDSEYHASGILASKLVQGVEFFRHNDCADLENKIRNYLENSPLPCGWGQRGWVNSQNNSSAQFSNNESTHPLTPSAREGESIDLPCNDEMVANLESKIDSSLRESAVADSWQSTGFTKETSATPRFANAVKQPSKSSDLKKQSESRTEKQINADSLQVRVSQNAQSLHNRLPRESCGFSRNDEIWANCHDFTQGVESRNDEVGTDCHDLQNKSRNDEVVADSHNLDSSLDSLAHNDKIHIESYLQKHRLAPFLAQNLALALKAVQIFGTDLPIKIDLDSLPKLDLHGRFEQITPNITIDVGHNQNAALAIKKQLNDKKIILVYNSYFQKNISEILSILKDNILRVEILSVADNPRIIEQSKLEKILDSLQIAHTHFKGVDSLDSAQNYLIFGSFSVVEAFMRDFMNGAK